MRNCDQLQKELDDQKAKNNELRTKNWKVMEALKAAETNANAAGNNKQTDVDKLTNDLVQKEREAQKQFIERLFPDISFAPKKVTDDDWQAEFNRAISSYVERLKKGKESTNGSPSSPQKSQDEGMLNKLQCHIESEEIKWRNELAAKQAEIERLMENRVKVAQDNSSSFANGPAYTERCSSSSSVASSLLGDINKKPKTKKRKKKVSFSRNTNICSNLGCQFLYCDGVSCSRDC
nr:unnamed protein product [Callosobruchus chinensis]